jgi:hypothetical protein
MTEECKLRAFEQQLFLFRGTTRRTIRTFIGLEILTALPAVQRHGAAPCPTIWTGWERYAVLAPSDSAEQLAYERKERAYSHDSSDWRENQ